MTNERLQDGRYHRNTVDALLDALMDEAKEEFGDDLNDSQTAVIRMFYRPIAIRLAMAQQDIGLVLDSSQIEHASGEALDLLTALIGVPRDEASPAEGHVTVYVDEPDTVDHNIPSGTRVGTNEFDGQTYTTTQSATLSAGDYEVTIPIEAEEGGVAGNTGPNTITIFPSGEPFAGAQVTNKEGTDGGSEEENDDQLRERAQDELAEGARSTAPALVSRVSRVQGVSNVNIFVNDTSEENGRGHGLPPHSFEIITNGGDKEDVASMILDTKAAGDYSAHGVNGEDSGEVNVDLPNHQSLPVGFSYAAEVPVYAEVNIQVDPDNYMGDDYVQDNIAEYIGGTDTEGIERNGELRIGDDVVHSHIERQALDVDGVYDIDLVTIGDDPEMLSEDNMVLEDHEQAYTDVSSSGGFITVNTTEV